MSAAPLPHVAVDARKARDFGIGRYVLGLLGGLARTGALRLTALVGGGDEGLLPAGVSAVRCDAAGYSVRELFAVRAALAALSPDLFHAPHYVVPLAPPRASVVTVHDLIHLRRPEHATLAKRLYATTMVRRALRLSRAVLTVSRAAAADLARFEPSAAGKTVVVPNGVEPRFTAEVPGAERDRVRQALGIGGTRYVLFLGNDKPHKNLAGLAAAFARVHAAEPGVRLVLAGGAASSRQARLRLLEGHGIDRTTVDTGVVADPDVPALVAGAALLVLPSFLEGFGLPVLEAQACGTPVVCSDRGGLPEAAGDAAVLVDPERPDDIARGVLSVLRDERLARDLRARGLSHASAFTWDAAAARTLAVYRRVLGVPG